MKIHQDLSNKPLMKHALLTLLTTLILLSGGTVNSLSFAQTTKLPPITNLGDITISEEATASQTFKSMLETETPAVFSINWIPTSGLPYNILETAEAQASSDMETSRNFFRKDFYQDSVTGQYLHYVDQADVVITSSDDFEAFLSRSKGKSFNRLTMKLNHYDDAEGYPYPKDMGFKGAYRVKDERIAGDSVLRTIVRYTSWEKPLEKVYLVKDYASYRKALQDAVTHFYGKFAVDTPTMDDSIYNTLKAYQELQDLAPQTEFSDGIIWASSTKSPGYLYGGIRYKARYTVSFNYSAPVKTEANLMKASNQKAAEIVKAVVQPEMTNYEKIMALHDYLVTHTTYNEITANFNLPYKNPHLISGALLEGSAVCSGYAWAMKALLENAGFECRVISGDVLTGPSKIRSAHAWNLVRLNGQFYHLDSTWDDSDGPNNAHHYGYFLVPDKILEGNHFWDTAAYPVCNDSSLDYYAQRGWYVNTEERFEQMALDRIRRGELEITFRSDTFSHNWVNDRISTAIAEAHPQWSRYRFDYLTQGNIRTLTLRPE